VVVKHLYVFGYETPGQAKANADHGWDDEDSAAVFVEATSAEDALEWGRRISDAFVSYLYGDSGVRWSSLGFASWIEPDPTKAYDPASLSAIPSVRRGEFPDWAALQGGPRARRRDG
jgi:hypothetical protein